MNMTRTKSLIVSCLGVAILGAAAVVVWVGTASKPGDKKAEVVKARYAPESPSAVPPLPLATPAASESNLPPGGIGPVVPAEGGLPPLAFGETYYGRGERAFKSADYASASRDLRAEVTAHPDRYYPSYLLGLSLWKEGKTGDAVVALTTAAGLDPKSVRARVNLGRVLNDAGSYDEALAAADAAIALGSNSAEAHNVRGRALLNLGRTDESITAFETAVEKDPSNAWARNNLGYALITARRFTDAVPPLEEAVRLSPDRAVFQNNLGMAYEHTGRVDDARTAYRKAVRSNEGSDRGEKNLARLGGSLDEEEPDTEEGSTK